MPQRQGNASARSAAASRITVVAEIAAGAARLRQGEMSNQRDLEAAP